MRIEPPAVTERYRAITRQNVPALPEWQRLDADCREAVDVVSRVLPFRTNEHVVRQLIDWDRVPDDPMFQLTFPQRAMLDAGDYEQIRDLIARKAPAAEIERAADALRFRLNPQPDGQLTHNVPEIGGQRLDGIQHKYQHTVLFFPSQGQTCHAYCTYCFRWAQFVGIPELKLAAHETAQLVAYLQDHPAVTDVLFTGGDPLIMKTQMLRRYVEPMLVPSLGRVQNLRIGTKALAFWPQRFVTDPDADDLLRLFEQIVAAGRHLALMAHVSHPVELTSPIAVEAIRRIRATGAEIRVQAPLVRHVNDDPSVWAALWKECVRLGMIPYYMFVERDTGPRNYFEVPLERAYEIYRSAYQRVGGLAHTVRGPSMSAFPGKVRVLGVQGIAGEKVFVLDFLQARDPDWVLRPFFARFDPSATWFDQLKPAFGESRFFFEEEPRSHPGPAGERIATATLPV